MQYLKLDEVLWIHQKIIDTTRGPSGIRDKGVLESALAQPSMTFDGSELYPSLAEKAAALAFSLINNHPFVDGNKRIGHAALEAFLMLNGKQLETSVDDAEQTILGVAAGNYDREHLLSWIKSHLVDL